MHFPKRPALCAVCTNEALSYLFFPIYTFSTATYITASSYYTRFALIRSAFASSLRGNRRKCSYSDCQIRINGKKTRGRALSDVKDDDAEQPWRRVWNTCKTTPQPPGGGSSPCTGEPLIFATLFFGFACRAVMICAVHRCEALYRLAACAAAGESIGAKLWCPIKRLIRTSSGGARKKGIIHGYDF